MAANGITKVTERSWFQRLGSAFIGVFIGILLFLASFPLLWWNEGRAVQTARSLDEAAEQVVHVDGGEVNPGKEGELVHMVDEAVTGDVLSDPAFPVEETALKLRRDAEMYQWEEETRSETERETGGGERTVTTYSYHKTWSSRPIDSSRFEKPEGHENPSVMEYEPRELVAADVSAGAFTLPPFLVEKIGGYESVSLPEDEVEAMGTRYTVHDGRIYIGDDPVNPRIGDQRIEFGVVLPKTVSIIARQVGDTFEHFQTEAGDRIALLSEGRHSAEHMIAEAHRRNVLTAWLLRLAGFVLMALGLGLVFKPLAVFGDVLPIVGDLLRMGIGIFALFIGIVLTLLTLSAAWLFYRPLLGIALLIVAAAVFLGIKKYASRAGEDTEKASDAARST